MNKIIVAIDGYSSCGKSTMAKQLAARAGYTYIDTGAMYRAVALYCLRNGLMTADKIDIDGLKQHIADIKIEFRTNAEGKTETWLNGENVESQIRTLEVGTGASRVSELKFVREFLVAQQKAMGKQKGIVMDGRDIGTVVFPEAELKIFVTARPEVRAKRRYDELRAKGETLSFDEVLASTIERDNRDQNRAESPLKQAPDALVLDNSTMTPAEQNEWLEKTFVGKASKC
ncbi:MAG: (d)CMP kinase [Prevotellaceae bacterium]|jgi:cytidylate kinase|nr:(d)CMP kinase [Prevotellaceae bacterium]